MDYLFGDSEEGYYLYFISTIDGISSPMDGVSPVEDPGKFPDTLVSRPDLDGRTGGCLFWFDRQLPGDQGVPVTEPIKFMLMQRLAIFSFIGIVVLLLASTAHEAGVRSNRNKAGGIAGTYIAAKPPVETTR